MALWGDGPRFEDAEDAKRAVEELVKERDELKHTKEALECLIKNQKSVLDELDVQVDAAQRRASCRSGPDLRTSPVYSKYGMEMLVWILPAA